MSGERGGTIVCGPWGPMATPNGRLPDCRFDLLRLCARVAFGAGGWACAIYDSDGVSVFRGPHGKGWPTKEAAMDAADGILLSRGVVLRGEVIRPGDDGPAAVSDLRRRVEALERHIDAARKGGEGE